MLTPSKMILVTSKGRYDLDYDDIEFWTRQIVHSPEEFYVYNLPTGEIIVAEHEDGSVKCAFVTSGWPQMSGAPYSW